MTRISRINHALVLISRIQNDQFTASEKINLNEKINENLRIFDDLASAKQIKVSVQMEDSVVKEMNPDLVDVLLGNLFSNAVRHNIPGGFIHINLGKHTLEIRNSGKESNPDTARLFERFNKANPSSGSPGLGLAIVRKITEVYKIEINYRIEKDVHIVTLEF